MNGEKRACQAASEDDTDAVGSGSILRVPVLGELMRQRVVALALIGAALLQAGLTAADLPAWECPFRATFGLRCFGCGLTRGVVCLAGGRWTRAMQLHPFAPFFLAGFVLLVVHQFLPAGLRSRLQRWVRRVECRTGITGVFLLLFCVYGAVRLAGELAAG